MISLVLVVRTVAMQSLYHHLRKADIAHWGLRGHQNLISAKLLPTQTIRN